MTIKQIQHLLSFLGFSVGAVDGLYGPATAKAITAFQAAFGLPPDGEAGPDTQQALRHAVAYGMPEAGEEGTIPNEAPGTFWDGIVYFRRAEFACKCGQYHDPYCDGYPAEMDERVVRLADGARAHFGRPGHVVSGLRCKQHNADSGGVANSQHMDGTACDLAIDGVSAASLLSWIQAQQGVRYAYAINGTNVHFDVPRG